MRLELGTFPVKEVVLGRRTRWDRGVLEVDKDELLREAARYPRIKNAALELARPGESSRVTYVRDIIEPRIKVGGPGRVYPGVCGRPVTVRRRPGPCIPMSCLMGPSRVGNPGRS